jgi:hypothetical protein
LAPPVNLVVAGSVGQAASRADAGVDVPDGRTRSGFPVAEFRNADARIRSCDDFFCQIPSCQMQSCQTTYCRILWNRHIFELLNERFISFSNMSFLQFFFYNMSFDNFEFHKWYIVEFCENAKLSNDKSPNIMNIL